MPLNVIIAGAGIGGLTTALFLRSSGHKVSIFERTTLATEFGAALHLAPNANGLLKRLNIDAEALGAIQSCWFTEYDSTSKEPGKQMFNVNTKELEKYWEHKWLMCHRVHLHNGLKSKAVEVGVTLHTGVAVTAVDCENSSIILENGEVHKGDVVIIADGGHSKLRVSVTGDPTRPHPSGKSAFRFLVPTATALADPQCRNLAENDGQLNHWAHPSGRRIVCYKCANNTVMNLVGIHLDATEGEGERNYSSSKVVSTEEVLEVFAGFPPDALALLGHATDVKRWTLYDFANLTTWTKGSAALLGDAAHPLLPYQAQGGAQAIEDAAAIGAMLPADTKVEEIPERLKLYQKARIERASIIQDASRQSGETEEAVGKGFDISKYTQFNFEHDAWEHAKQVLGEWEQGGKRETAS